MSSDSITGADHTKLVEARDTEDSMQLLREELEKMQQISNSLRADNHRLLSALDEKEKEQGAMKRSYLQNIQYHRFDRRTSQKQIKSLERLRKKTLKELHNRSLNSSKGIANMNSQVTKDKKDDNICSAVDKLAMEVEHRLLDQHVKESDLKLEKTTNLMSINSLG